MEHSGDLLPNQGARIVMEFEDLYKTCRKRYAKVEYTTFHQKLARGMGCFSDEISTLEEKKHVQLTRP